MIVWYPSHSTKTPAVTYQIANMNIARFRHAPDDPRLADFVNNLDHINALSDKAQGFVWRLRDDSGNAMAICAYEDPRIILNLSVWETIEDLMAFAYRSEHVTFFRRRHEWFETMATPAMCLWWTPEGERPSPHEARRRLEHLIAHGPTAEAFTFKERFPPPV